MNEESREESQSTIENAENPTVMETAPENAAVIKKESVADTKSEPTEPTSIAGKCEGKEASADNLTLTAQCDAVPSETINAFSELASIFSQSSQNDLDNEKTLNKESGSLNEDTPINKDFGNLDNEFKIGNECNSVKHEITIDNESGRKEVPNDFFDDLILMGQDFLFGLDVIDAWEDGSQPADKNTKPIKEEQSENESIEKSKPIKAAQDEKTKDIKAENPEETSKKAEVRKPRKSLEKNDHSAKKENGSVEKSIQVVKRKSRTRDTGYPPKDLLGNQTRRDPNKAKRDIQRDKEKCTRDKLKVVETGLVPPGMEMELSESLANAKRDYEKSQISLAEQKARFLNSNNYSKRRVSRSPSPRNRSRYKDQSPSPTRRNYRNSGSRRSSSLTRRTSPKRYRRSPNKSPPYRKRSPHAHWDSPDRSRGHRPSYGRSRSRSRSPYRDRRKSSSTHRTAREEWSPPRKKQKSFLDELEEKLSGQQTADKLREIREKINGGPSEPQRINKYPMHPMVPPVPAPGPMAPMPVPNPVNVNPMYPTSMAPVYDQQFFIGPQDVQPFMPINNYSNPMAAPNYYNPVNPRPPIPERSANPTPDDLNQLLKDPSITLSSLLQRSWITRDTPKVPSLRKERVLTRCQDAVKIISESAKSSGHFYYKCMRPSKKAQNETVLSPMKIQKVIRFGLTAKFHQSETSVMDKLMQNLGLKEFIPKASKKPLPHEIPRKTTLQPDKVLMKMTQTDPINCEECEMRQEKQFVDVGVQCGSQMETIGCQVNEEEFLSTARSALKNILKVQSLAALTPAQILAQLGGSKETASKKEPEMNSSRPMSSASSQQSHNRFQPNVPNNSNPQRFEWRGNQQQQQQQPGPGPPQNLQHQRFPGANMARPQQQPMGGPSGNFAGFRNPPRFPQQGYPSPMYDPRNYPNNRY